MNSRSAWKNFAPAWLGSYQTSFLQGDVVAGLIVAIMLIPQSLAYALLAGLPLEVGMYASILPMIAYAIFGTSMALAVGPVAVISLMTFSALAPLATVGSPEYVHLAIQLSLLSGIILILLGIFRFGFISHLLSHPVINGFIIGSAILISTTQIKHLVGVRVASNDVFGTLLQLWRSVSNWNLVTLSIGLSALLLLWLSREKLPKLLSRIGINIRVARLIGRLSPMFAVLVSTYLVGRFHLDKLYGVKVVGYVPPGIPNLHIQLPDFVTLEHLWLPALLISIIGYVESVSVAQSLALKKKQRINPNKELLGLGAANVASAFSGGYAVTGGFARSIVNFDAGANTPLAGVVSAIFMTIVLMGFTGLFTQLPQATLAATIIVAVLSLVEFSTLREAWRYDKTDAIALLCTCFGVLTLGVEEGVLIGVVFSLGSYYWRSSHPHIAIVGRVPGTEHFRNVDRHAVEGSAEILVARVDENLFFGNVQEVEETIYRNIQSNQQIKHVVLMLSAVNRIDATALQILSDINLTLQKEGRSLHLAEVKGPVMDRLSKTEFLQSLSGNCYLSTNEAYESLGRNRAGFQLKEASSLPQ